MSLVQSVPQKGKVAVLGAGISGLSFAYFLNKLRPDVRIHIYEAKRQPGGWIKSETVGEGIKLERGPRTIRGVSDGSLLIVDMLKQLGYGDHIEVMPKTSIANKKYLLSEKNELIQVPDDGKLRSFFNFLWSDLSSGLIPGLIGEPFRKSRPAQDESVESFMSRRFGSKNISSNILSAVLHGIHAGDVATLSARSIIPKLVTLEEDHGSIIKGMLNKMRSTRSSSEPSNGTVLPSSLQQYEEKISPNAELVKLASNLKKYPMVRLRDGLQTLPNAIALYLESQPNVNISYGTSIELINFGNTSLKTTDSKDEVKYDHIRSTIDIKQLAKLLVDAPTALTTALQKIEYISILLVNIFSRNVPLIPKAGNGFGFLVPKKITNPEGLLGVIYDSDIEQHVIPLHGQSKTGEHPPPTYSKVTLMMGGHFYKETGVPSPKVAMRKIRHVLEHRLGVDLDKVQLKIEGPGSSPVPSIGDNEILVSYVINRDCIPQLNVGYAETFDEVTSLIGDKFSFGGMAFGSGIGVPDCVQNGLEGALRLSKA